MPEIWLELAVKDAETKAAIPKLELEINGTEKVLTDENGLLKTALAGGEEYYIRGTHPGYLDNSITIGADGEPGVIKATLWMYKGVTGKSFTLENIYYDFDKWDILPQSDAELDKLVNILRENHGLKVELGSHTDSRGTDEYNLWLSGQRSQSAVGYIVSKGIPKENIIAEKYGESQPYIPSPKNESEFRQNRRTTFKIIEMGSQVPKIVSVPADQSMYGKYSVTPIQQAVANTMNTSTNTTGFNLPPVNVSGKNYRVQFYASKKPININAAMKEIVEKFSQYGMINCEEDFLIKYQIGPFSIEDDAISIYNKVFNLGYQVMMLEYDGNKKIKMLLPD
jgi:outer membrane protein OmpA-like peptidoglycan-associated protein